jgi:hypothetical protein
MINTIDRLKKLRELLPGDQLGDHLTEMFSLYLKNTDEKGESISRKFEFQVELKSLFDTI